MEKSKGAYRVILFLAVLASMAPGCRSSFEVKPDSSDFVTYRFGGGEAGADFTEMTIRGDGTVSYAYHFPLEEKDVITRKSILSTAETKNLFQGLVNAGLFILESDRLGGADLDWADIRARIDNRRVEAQFTGSFEVLREVRQVLSPLLQRMHPERWSGFNSSKFPFQSSGGKSVQNATFTGQTEPRISGGLAERTKCWFLLWRTRSTFGSSV